MPYKMFEALAGTCQPDGTGAKDSSEKQREKRMAPLMLSMTRTALESFRKCVIAKGILVAVTVSACQLGGIAMTEEVKVTSGLSFSPDNTKLLLDRCVPGQYCTLGVYDLSTGQSSEYRSPQHERWSMAHYSDDGQKIAFVRTPIKGGHYSYDYEQMQIATMNPDGSDVRTITTHVGPKYTPAFSHAGDKIIYIQSGRVQTERKMPTAKHDVYEVELTTGKATQLTHYAFSQMDRPFYLPDDQEFIFAADYLTSFPGLTEFKAIEIKREEFKAKYAENTIFIMGPHNQELKPILIQGEESGYPRITRDGKTLRFVARVKNHPLNEKSKSRYFSEIFERTETGDHVMKSSLGMAPISQFAMSADGSLMAVQYEQFSGDTFKRNPPQLAVISTRDNTVRMISIPVKATPIN
jgi:hypothetical protein